MATFLVQRTQAYQGLTSDADEAQMRYSIRLFVAIAALLLLAASPADAKRPPSFALKKLTLGAGGAENYLFTAGNQVNAQATLDTTALSYRFQVFDPSGVIRATTPCALPNRKKNVTGAYTVQTGDPVSGATA